MVSPVMQVMRVFVRFRPLPFLPFARINAVRAATQTYVDANGIGAGVVLARLNE